MSSLESIQFLQEKLHELEPFFVFLNFFDTPYFYFLLIVFWMVFIDKKKGKTLFFLLALSGYLNAVLKRFYALPRPSELNPDLALVSAVDYGFPSGGAQAAMVIALFVLKEFPKKRYWIVYPFLIGLSRVVIGVHFPLDIFGGYVFGGALFWIASKFKMAKWPDWTLIQQMMVISFPPLFFLSVKTAVIWIFCCSFILAHHFIPFPEKIEKFKKLGLFLMTVTLSASLIFFQIPWIIVALVSWVFFFTYWIGSSFAK